MPDPALKEALLARKRREEAFVDFVRRLSLMVSKNRSLITITLSNIFTMRLIGNKTQATSNAKSEVRRDSHVAASASEWSE